MTINYWRCVMGINPKLNHTHPYNIHGCYIYSIVKKIEIYAIFWSNEFYINNNLRPYSWVNKKWHPCTTMLLHIYLWCCQRMHALHFFLQLLWRKKLYWFSKSHYLLYIWVFACWNIILLYLLKKEINVVAVNTYWKGGLENPAKY